MRWLTATVFVATFVVRLLSVTGFPNDHYLYLAPAQQMLAGEWPSRDFVDPGTPLMYGVSAAARLVVESPQLAEALVVATAYAVAASLTLYAAFQVSGSLLIAAAVTLAEIAMFPRSYHYPKLLLYAAGIPAIWHYMRSPGLRRTVLVAAWVAVAFLFRHDHGVYLGGAAVLAALLTDGALAVRVRRALVMAALIALTLVPYLAYVAAASGLASHLSSGFAYSSAEAERTFLGLPAFDAAAGLAPHNLQTGLFYLFHLLAAFTLAIAAWRRRPDVVVVAVLGIVLNVSMLRDPLQARLPDVAVPLCIAAAWLLAESWRLRGSRRVAGVTVAAVLSAFALVTINQIGRPREQLSRAGFFTRPLRWPAMARERVAELQTPYAPRQFPSDAVEALVPFFEYLGRCTTPAHRLLVAGSAPEIYVYARRLFAGGQPMFRRGFFTTERDQASVLQRLQQQEVPLAVVLPDADFDAFEFVMKELETNFTPVAEVPIEGHDGAIALRASRRMTPLGADAATGWPCFV